MRVKFIRDEDFVNYKKPSMFIGVITCDFKCCKESNLSIKICQNEAWFYEPVIDVLNHDIVQRYLLNPITSSVVIGGLEPLKQVEEVVSLVSDFRKHTDDDIVIYTGYNKEEILSTIEELVEFTNIIIKFGRYIPNQQPHCDKILGINLASDNQYAEKIS